MTLCHVHNHANAAHMNATMRMLSNLIERHLVIHSPRTDCRFYIITNTLSRGQYILTALAGYIGQWCVIEGEPMQFLSTEHAEKLIHFNLRNTQHLIVHKHHHLRFCGPNDDHIRFQGKHICIVRLLSIPIEAWVQR
jgi:hypothetical protein